MEGGAGTAGGGGGGVGGEHVGGESVVSRVGGEVASTAGFLRHLGRCGFERGEDGGGGFVVHFGAGSGVVVVWLPAGGRACADWAIEGVRGGWVGGDAETEGSESAWKSGIR